MSETTEYQITNKNTIQKSTLHLICFGRFDLLSPGHMCFLENACRLGRITVVLSDDYRSSILLPGSINHLGERILMVQGCRYIDRIIVLDYSSDKKDSGYVNILQEEKPDICIRGDHRSLHDVPDEILNKMRIPTLTIPTIKGYRSTNVIVDQILKNNNDIESMRQE